MKSTEEFQAFYQTSLLPILRELEMDRKRLVRKIRPFHILFILFALTLAGCFIPGMLINNRNPELYSSEYQLAQSLMLIGAGAWGCLFILGGIYWLAYRFSFSRKIGDLKFRFKTLVISKMVKFTDESLVYEPYQGISQAEYQESKIFITNVDGYHGEDMVMGKLGSTSIRFSEVHSQKREVRGDGKGERWKTLFKGIVFKADFNKHFTGRTVVLTDVAESFLGSIGTMFQKMNTKRDPLIKLEDVEFEKEFAVYGTDPVEAHYILSPALMQRLVEFKRKSGRIDLSFINASLYMAIPIPININLFEPKIYSTMINYDRIAGYNKYLMLAVGIVEYLNLNTRIWTKE